MKKVRTVIYNTNKKIHLEVFDCNFLEKVIGLMFSSKESAKILQFRFNEGTQMGIHSFFVNVDFLAIWVDEKDNVVQVDKVKPWTSYVRPKKKYVRLIEIPIHKKHMNIVKKFN